MRSLTFCIENAIELLPDEVRRSLGAEAREFAEEGKEPRQDFGRGETYFDGVLAEHKRIFWVDSYNKRRARISRMAQRNKNG